MPEEVKLDAEVVDDAPPDDVPPPDDEGPPDPAIYAWDSRSNEERRDVLEEARVRVLDFCNLLWDQIPLDVQATVRPLIVP